MLAVRSAAAVDPNLAYPEWPHQHRRLASVTSPGAGAIQHVLGESSIDVPNLGARELQRERQEEGEREREREREIERERASEREREIERRSGLIQLSYRTWTCFC